MIISIDHGNYAIKTVHDNFTSGINEHTLKPPLTTDTIEYGESIWTLSGQRIFYMRDKTKDERFFVLSLFAIARELTKSGNYQPNIPVDLSTGLPPEHYSVLKEKFIQYFKRPGKIEFNYNGKPISIIIRNVFVYPQGYAAVVPRAHNLLKTPMVYIIDIGGYTTDVLLLRYGTPDLQVCRSLEMGTITLNNAVIGKVSALHDISVEDSHISAVLQEHETVLHPDVKKTIDNTAKTHTEDILNKLRELHVDLRSSPAIFIGGGACLFKPYIEKSNMVVKSDFILDTKANAIGYYMLASAQMKKLSPQNADGGTAVEG